MHMVNVERKEDMLHQVRAWSVWAGNHLKVYISTGARLEFGVGSAPRKSKYLHTQEHTGCSQF